MAGMDAEDAGTATNASARRFQRRSQTLAGRWKTLQCVSAPKILTMVGQKKQTRAPADTSGFVLVKFQVVSVAPDDRPPQVEAAAHTLQEMACGAVQRVKSCDDSPSTCRGDATPNSSGVHNRAETGNRVRREVKYEDVPQKYAVDDGGSSSAGSGRDIHQCHFPGCTKTFDRRYNLKVHFRRHTNETPYPCKQSGCAQMFKWRSSLAHHMKTRHASTDVARLSAVQKVRSPPVSEIRSRAHVLHAMRYPAGESPGTSSRESSKDYDEETDRGSVTGRIAKRSAPVPRQSPTTVNHHHGLVRALDTQPHRDEGLENRIHSSR